MTDGARIQTGRTDLNLHGRASDGRQILYLLLSVRELRDGWINTAYHATLGNGRLRPVLEVGPPAVETSNTRCRSDWQSDLPTPTVGQVGSPTCR